MCDASNSYNTYILLNFEKYLGFSGTVWCSACILVRTVSQGGYGCNKGGHGKQKVV